MLAGSEKLKDGKQGNVEMPHKKVTNYFIKIAFQFIILKTSILTVSNKIYLQQIMLQTMTIIYSGFLYKLVFCIKRMQCV